jgi:hypothetical protein
MATHPVSEYSIQDLRRIYYLSSISKTVNENRSHLSEILECLIRKSMANEVFKEVADYASKNAASLTRSIDSLSYTLAFIVKTKIDQKTTHGGKSTDGPVARGLNLPPVDLFCSLQHAQGH